MTRSPLVLVLVLVLGLVRVPASCAPSAPRSPAAAPDLALHGESAPIPLGELTRRAPLTVLLFFASDCPVQKAHDARLRDLLAAYAPRGVAFAAVDAETGIDVAADRAALQRRGLSIPLLEDRGAALADALGVEYSTHVVVLAPDRKVLYSGAFDADRTHLTPNGEPYLREALDAALAGRPVDKARTEALGCPLRKH